MLVVNAIFPDVLAISETWINGQSSDSEVAGVRNNLVRTDRPENKQGGCVVIHNKNMFLVSTTRSLPFILGVLSTLPAFVSSPKSS